MAVKRDTPGAQCKYVINSRTSFNRKLVLSLNCCALLSRQVKFSLELVAIVESNLHVPFKDYRVQDSCL